MLNKNERRRERRASEYESKKAFLGMGANEGVVGRERKEGEETKRLEYRRLLRPHWILLVQTRGNKRLTRTSR